jgi:hypothetical protein
MADETPAELTDYEPPPPLPPEIGVPDDVVLFPPPEVP